MKIKVFPVTILHPVNSCPCPKPSFRVLYKLGINTFETVDDLTINHLEFTVAHTPL